MGMYDHIRCEYPLPEGWQDRTFQSKSLDCAMDDYTITADGRLIHHTVRWEVVPKEERPHPEAPDDDMLSFFGSMRTVPTGDVEIPYHGDIHFYDWDHARGLGKGLRTFTARFTEGRVTRLTDHGTEE